MINHIDLGSVLRGTVCDLYSNLVTRSTGAAVRTEIEQQLATLGGRTLTVIDFSHVRTLDFSCADEIVAKLLLRYTADDAPVPDAYFVFRGVSDDHLEAIEAVLERHGLALVVEAGEGPPQLVGRLDDDQRNVWELIARLGRAAAYELSASTGWTDSQVRQVIDGLLRRRLVMRLDGEYVAVGATP